MFSLVRSSARTLVVVLLAYLYSRLLLYTRAYRLSFSAFLAVVRFKRAQARHFSPIARTRLFFMRAR